MKSFRLALVATALTGLAWPALAEDLTVVYKTTSPSGSGIATSYHSATHMRMGSNDSDMIIEYGSGRVVTIDHARKQYSEITLAEMEAAMARLQQAMAQMQQQMAALPPQVRQQMEQMAGGGAAAVTLSKGGVRKVAGYDCQEWVVAAGTAYTQRVCASTAVVPPAVSVDYRRFASLAGSAGAMANSPIFKTFARAGEELKKVQGFHLADSVTARVMGKGFDNSKEATEVRKGPIPASAFDVATIAKGYKKVPNPMTTMK